MNPAEDAPPGVGTLPRQGRLFVVSGPSGVGKDTVLERLFTRVSGAVRSVSATTRPPRPGEVEGRDYYFVSVAEFEEGVRAERFLEYARYGEYLYGTPRDRVAEQREHGLDVILKIEVQGALRVKSLAPDAILIFLQPPSLEELERRLRARATDTEARIAERLVIARTELASLFQYDYLVTNDDLETAVETLHAILIAERCRIQHE